MANVCSGLNPNRTEKGMVRVRSRYFLTQETILSMPDEDN